MKELETTYDHKLLKAFAKYLAEKARCREVAGSCEALEYVGKG